MPNGVEKSFGVTAGSPQPATSRHSHSASEATNAVPHGDRLAGLDVLRLLAALAVVLFHFGYAGPTRGTSVTHFPEIAAFSKYGFLGVDLFFLISGYVITASAQGRTWHQFAVARALRLYPAYVVCMTITALVVICLGTRGPDVTPTRWLANLTMVAPAFGQPFMDGAYWSIVVEMVFYGWVGVMIALGLFERRLLTILAIWLAVAALNETIIQSRVVRLGLCSEYAGLFASGILIQRLRAGERSLLAWGLLGLAFSLGMLHVFEVQRIFATLYGDGVDREILWTLHLGMYALFIGALWLSRWVHATPAVLTIGALTYPLYLIHQHVGYALIDTLAPLAGSGNALAISVGCVVIVAFIVQRWLEPAGRAIFKRALAHIPERSSIAVSMPNR